LTDCDQGLSEKIITLEHRINALSFQLDSQKDRQKIDTMEMTTQEIDNRIDDMEPLLKLQREASIASPSPSPPAIEPATLPPDDQNAIESDPANPPVTEAIEPAIEDASDTLPGGDNITTHDPAIDQKLTNKEIADILGCHSSNLSKWLKTKIIPEKYRDKCEFNHNKTKIVLI
jgi:hypothetical protein